MRVTRRLVYLTACVAPAWAIAVWVTGGVSWRWFDVQIGTRDVVRPLSVAVIAAGVYGLLFRSWWREDSIWTSWVAARLAPGLVAAVALLTFLAGVIWGTFAASGADAYGYVSQADLWLQGHVRLPQPLARDLPWPDVDWTFSPLGYRPATIPHAIVPTYPPGLPILMSAAKLGLGPEGPFYVVPIFGALVVWLTYRLGRDWTNNPLVGLLAALLLAVSPIFLYQLMLPMTDVPVAACWAAVFLLACSSRSTRIGPLVTGVVAGVALTIRPNVVLLGLAPVAAWFWPARYAPSIRREALQKAMWYGAGLIPGVFIVAAVQTYLYGSPLSSGYGSLADLYSVRNTVVNLRRYGQWLLETQTPFVVLSTLVFFDRKMLTENENPAVSRRAAVAAAVVLLTISYIIYAPFDDWTYLRFFLPIFPILLTCVAAAFVSLMKRLWPSLRIPVALLIVIPLLAYEVRLASDRAAFRLQTFERRYLESGFQVARTTPPSAVIFAVQHSGSVRYYGGRQSIRFDLLAPEWLDRAIGALEEKGIRCYALLDDWEEPVFRSRFSAFSKLGRLDWRPVAEVVGPVHVRLFELAGEK